MEFNTNYQGVNKQGLRYLILDGSRTKRIKIKFEIDNLEVITTKQSLSEGLPCHPTYGKLLSGVILKDKEGNEFKLIDKETPGRWNIEYLKDNIKCTRDTKSIVAGRVKHPTDGVPKIGQKYTTRSGEVEVISMKSSIDITVKFKDGSVTKTSANDLRKGVVGHPTSNLCIGQQFKTKSGWKYEVIKYVSPYEVHVKMQDNSIEIQEAARVHDGGFKPLNQPSVLDIGYIGHGKYTSLNKSKGEKFPKEIIGYWQRMLNRCYNPTEIIKDGTRNYIYVEIISEWFCLQHFTEWALTQPNWDLGFDLDKDLIGNGKEYSSSNCTFLPPNVNVFLSETKYKPVHNLPIGVQYIKPSTTGAKEGYVARCHTGETREYLGYFDHPMDAYYEYKKAKEKFARVLAEKYKNVLTNQSFDKWSNYELTTIYVEPIDNCILRNIVNNS